MAPCSKCSTSAVTHIRYSGQHLCEEHFLRFFRQRTRAALREQGRLPEGLTVVALSGGKDSVACLDVLHDVAQEHPRIELAAVSIDEGIAGYRESALDICRQVTEERGIPWHLVSVKELAGYDIDEYAAGGGKAPTGQDRPACGPCGVFRRLGMNQVARDLGAKAVATGHNLDDMAQTVLMNVLGGDVERLGRLAPHDTTQPGLVRRILPLRMVPEKEVLLYALLKGLPLHHEAECPYAARANRFALRDVLWGLEADQPGTRHRLLAFQDKLKPMLAGRDVAPATACPTCGEPTSGTTCKACDWRTR